MKKSVLILVLSTACVFIATAQENRVGLKSFTSTVYMNTPRNSSNIFDNWNGIQAFYQYSDDLSYGFTWQIQTAAGYTGCGTTIDVLPGIGKRILQTGNHEINMSLGLLLGLAFLNDCQMAVGSELLIDYSFMFTDSYGINLGMGANWRVLFGAYDVAHYLDLPLSICFVIRK